MVIYLNIIYLSILKLQFQIFKNMIKQKKVTTKTTKRKISRGIVHIM
jgi:hypothetical protein